MDHYRNYEAIQFERSGKILTVTLSLPDSLNAVNGMLHEELSRLFPDISTDRDTDVVILTGAGRAFCAGGDLDWMQDAIDDPNIFERTVVEAKKIIFGMLDLEKPVICRLNGPAVGLGATIALFSDIIIADERAIISDPHVLVGLVAGDGGAAIWPYLIGFARAKEYLLTGDSVTATDAARIGLINRAVARDDLDTEVNTLAARLASGATKAIRWTKASVNVHLKQIASAVLETSLAYETITNGTQDHQEGIKAFRERRKPTFVGN